MVSATSRPPLALIAGPTASGKSALALALARRANGVIINADSAQLYAGTPILTAAPDEADRAAAPHRLYGTQDPAVPCSAADWAGQARSEIAAAQDRGQLPILVGGTGLYLRALIDGIAPVPPIDPDVRAAVRAAAVTDNFAELTVLDPVGAARLNPGDTSRVARALEVVLSSGQPLAHWQAQASGGLGDQVVLRALVLLPPRAWLLERCDARVAAMVAAGALDEVRAFYRRGLHASLPAMRAIGLREFAAHLVGAHSLDHAIAATRLATRQYAKRQYTWFANQPPADWVRLSEPLDAPGTLDRALATLDTAD